VSLKTSVVAEEVEETTLSFKFEPNLNLVLDPSFTYNYLMQNYISFEADYPYTAKTGTCRDVAVKSEVKLKSYAKLKQVDENLMRNGEMVQPRICFII
jgi:hypothetical protein